MIVVDLGCHTHASRPDENSIDRLIARFHPRYLYGFDPHPDVTDRSWTVGDTFVTVRRAAAWTHNGTVGFRATEAPLSSHVAADGDPVPCFDVAKWVKKCRGPITLKLDVEGSEYVLLEHLIGTRAIGNVGLLLVEWHPVEEWEDRRAGILEHVACPVEDW